MGAYVLKQLLQGGGLKDGPPSRTTDPISELKRALNGTLILEGPFNVAWSSRNVGNPWVPVPLG